MSGRHFLGVALMLLSLPVAAQEHPNVQRGFQADKVYLIDGIDNVNLYNGNLTLTIPIGNEYAGNGALHYRFVLSYNSENWDRETYIYDDWDPCHSGGIPPGECGQPYVKTVPSRSSNAGMGWLLTLGRLLSPADPAVNPGPAGQGTAWWSYTGPDGAQHPFAKHDSARSTVMTTVDGSFLRLVPLDNDRWEVDFPDGMTQTFGPVPNENTHRLEQIRDPFGNHLDVTYGTPDWTLTEYDAAGSIVRTHYVRFHDFTTDPVPPSNAPLNYEFGVSQIDLAAFNGQRAIYTINYSTDSIPYGCYGDQRTGETYGSTVPRIQSIVRPDGSQWTAGYLSTGCSEINSLILPTHGRMDWTWTTYSLPTTACRTPLYPDGDAPDLTFSAVDGVASKRLTMTDGQYFDWLYTQSTSLLASWPCPSGQLTQKAQQATTTVLSPDGRKTEHYFSIWNGAASWDPPNSGGSSPFDRSEYALPYTRSNGSDGSGCASAPTSSEFCRSSSEFICNNADCSSSTLLRSHYVRYEGESESSVGRYSSVGFEGFGYRREAAERTVFNDDAGAHVDVVRSDYDGLGHYRTTVTSDSWSGLSRTETTNYNSAKSAVTVDPMTWTNTPSDNRPPYSAPWLLNLFDRTTTTANGTTLKSEFCFNSGTGFLERKRTLANASQRQTNDLLAVFDNRIDEQLTLGNLRRERYYGGDTAPLSSDFDTCTTAVGDAPYTLTHEYAFGALKNTQYGGGITFRSLDLSIDQNTGLPVSSTDPAGLQTTYAYDAQGRLVKEAPPGLAWTSYTYRPTDTPASIVVQQWPYGGQPTGTALTERRLYYDGVGRVIQARTKMPDNWSVTQTTYDAFGRTLTSSMPEYRSDGSWDSTFTPANQQSFVYDPFGHATRVTAADNTYTSWDYVGMRQITRHSFLNTPPVEQITTELHDGLDRLWQVSEPGSISTTYDYDAGGHLKTVTMSTPESSQIRRFDYDGRGLLQSEQHPELDTSGGGSVVYSQYDARGHARQRVTGSGAAAITVVLSYDPAERLEKVWDLSGTHLLKEFLFGDRVSGAPLNTAGKLWKAKRYNSVPGVSGDTLVTETLAYGSNGLVSSKTTAVDSGGVNLQTFSQSYGYNDLGNPVTVTYPACPSCPANGGISTLTRTFDHGLLTAVGSYASSITYHADGIVKEVDHPGSIVDSIADDRGMGRPGRIDVKGCPISATITPQQPSMCVNTSNSATVTTTAGAAYTWWIENGTITSQTSSSISFTSATAGTVILHVTVTVAGCSPVSAQTSVTVTSSASITSGLPVDPSPIAPGTTATLMVQASGSNLTYQWYEGVASDTSHPVTGQTNASFTTPALTVSKNYWVRVSSSGCGTADSRTATVTVLAAPASVQATTESDTTKVMIVWSAVSNAGSYVVQVAPNINGPFSDVGLATTSLSAEHNAGSSASPVAYVYRVVSLDAQGRRSPALSPMDFAVTATTLFSDEPILKAATPIRAIHIVELRNAIDKVRIAAGKTPLWQGAAPPSGTVTSDPITSLLAGFNDARAAFSLPGFVWSAGTPSPQSGGAIRSEHIQEVRNALR